MNLSREASNHVQARREALANPSDSSMRAGKAALDRATKRLMSFFDKDCRFYQLQDRLILVSRKEPSFCGLKHTKHFAYNPVQHDQDGRRYLDERTLQKDSLTAVTPLAAPVRALAEKLVALGKITQEDVDKHHRSRTEAWAERIDPAHLTKYPELRAVIAGAKEGCFVELKLPPYAVSVIKESLESSRRNPGVAKFETVRFGKEATWLPFAVSPVAHLLSLMSPAVKPIPSDSLEPEATPADASDQTPGAPDVGLT